MKRFINEDLNAFVDNLILQYGEKNQDIVCIEELSELQKALTKCLRGKENKEHIAEEISHCIISIMSVSKVHNISKEMIVKKINEKMKVYNYEKVE